MIDKVLKGENYEKEFRIFSPAERFYFLRFSPVTAGDETAFGQFKADSETNRNDEVIGVLMMFSDVTKQRELDCLKAETLQLVSHELRSPLTSIQGLSDVLLKFPVAAAESEEMLATIHSEALRLNEIITHFLDIKRLESGTQELRLAPVEINKLIAECVNSAQTAAIEKDIEIEIAPLRSLPALPADAQILAQAVGNLLSNAVKYSPPHSIVKIQAARVASELQIIVSDDGFGIPDDRLDRIFDKFYRLERDSTSAIVGTGLGLAFVKEVAEKHGGRVTAESYAGGGSIFIMHLPY